MDQATWDDLYSERVWSGAVNGALAVEAADLEPGRALDVGSGEGGDALWLAARGWRVTAADISPVALDRAAASVPDEHRDRIEWVHADLTVTPPAAGAYDLVSLMYFPLLRSMGTTAVLGLAGAVAPGGLLLVVSHDMAAVAAQSEAAGGHGAGHGHGPGHGAGHGSDDGSDDGSDHDRAHEGGHDRGHGAAGTDQADAPNGRWRGPDPSEFLRPEEIADVLGPGWLIETLETRPRVMPTSGAGVGHVDDLVLRARRTV